jgi:hypothetical protein
MPHMLNKNCRKNFMTNYNLPCRQAKIPVITITIYDCY